MTSPVAPQPTPTRPSPLTKRRILAITSIGLAGLLAGLLAGCSSQIATTSATSSTYAQAAGNWQFTSAASTRLSSLGGSLSVQGDTVTGILHPLSTSNQCLPTTTPIPVTGTIGSGGNLTLTAPLSGGILTLSGTLAPTGKSLSNPTYGIAGGNCGLPTPKTSGTASTRDSGTPVTAQQYDPVSGTYTGTLTTSEGQTFSLSSAITQLTQPDADGIYHVNGSAASTGNACVPTSLPATASTIDGGSITTTYTDATTGTSITAVGTTSPDGASIAVSSWTINSPCGSDTGTGTLTRQ